MYIRDHFCFIALLLTALISVGACSSGSSSTTTVDDPINETVSDPVDDTLTPGLNVEATHRLNSVEQIGLEPPHFIYRE